MRYWTKAGIVSAAFLIVLAASFLFLQRFLAGGLWPSLIDRMARYPHLESEVSQMLDSLQGHKESITTLSGLPPDVHQKLVQILDWNGSITVFIATNSGALKLQVIPDMKEEGSVLFYRGEVDTRRTSGRVMFGTNVAIFR